MVGLGGGGSEWEWNFTEEEVRRGLMGRTLLLIFKLFIDRRQLTNMIEN